MPVSGHHCGAALAELAGSSLGFGAGIGSAYLLLTTELKTA